MDVYYQEAGAGPAVVLLHAGICDSRMWEPQWDTFPRAHRTIRYDQRGYGRSPLPPGSWSDARDLIGLLEALGIQRAALVGVSRGGRIALEVAVARPDLVGALVLVGAGLPGHDWSEPERLEAFVAEEDAAVGRGDLDAATEANLRLWVDGPGRSPADVDPSVRRLVGVMQRRALELQAPVWDVLEDRIELLVPDLAERLGQVRAPTLVLAGDQDLADIRAIAERLALQIRDARLAIVAGAAHLPSLERPAEFDDLVLGFFAEVEHARST
jgi:pimeloyl-ACP methyl ester carboxylesterase